MRRLLLVLMLLAAGVVVVLSVALTRLHQSPWDKTPSQFQACGRTYVLPAPQGVQRSVVDGLGLTEQAHIWTWQGKRSVWGKHLASSCGTNVYLKVGGNDFRSYNLSGGP